MPAGTASIPSPLHNALYESSPSIRVPLLLLNKEQFTVGNESGCNVVDS